MSGPSGNTTRWGAHMSGHWSEPVGDELMCSERVYTWCGVQVLLLWCGGQPF